MDTIPADVIRSVVAAALEEDRYRDDATVDYVGVDDAHAGAGVVTGEAGVVAGLALARETFAQVDDAVYFETAIADGARVEPGAGVFRVSGPARSLLGAERVALNFLQQMSGVASLAARFVDAVRDTGVTILDTRKTTPLWRDLQKYAVRCGGATNHRRDLRAAVLVKENHVRVVGGRDALVERLRNAVRPPAVEFVEVEVDSLEFLAALRGVPVDRVMFDNFSPDQVVRGIEIVRGGWSQDARPGVEVSGGITLDTVRDYAIPGVDYISVGALTHSAPALSMSMEVDA